MASMTHDPRETNPMVRTCVVAFSVLISAALVTGSLILLLKPKPVQTTKVSFKPVRMDPPKLR